MICAPCGGLGKVKAFVCGGPTAGYRDVKCRACGGFGNIPPVRLRQLEAAEARRKDRIARGLTLSKEAARLGMTPQALSKLEHLRRAPG